MKKYLLLLILFLILLTAVIWWTRGLSAPDPDSTQKVSFVIEEGESAKQIGESLKNEGLIKDATIFYLYLRQQGVDKKIQAGAYVLSPSMSLQELVTALSSGSIDIWVRLPEGARAEEIADILEEKMQNYDSGWKQELIKKEGRLFPDTYLIPKDADIEDVLRIINTNFESRLSEIGLSQTSPDINRILTIASLIEREAKFDEDRPIVASVIENRLSLGMPLQIDATVQYALGEEGDWWSPPTPKDLEINSPYNTYKNPGLPPAPIASPSLSAINAAANPSETDYLYYVNDSSGKLHFSTSLDGHNSNIEKHLQ